MPTAQPIDLLVSGGTLLTLAGPHAAIDDAAVGISGGTIQFACARRDAPPVMPRETLDAAGCLVMPGLINTHTHLPMTCFRGLADDLPLMEWLHEHMFPAEAKHVNREMIYKGALLGMAEMILSGTTTCCDSYFYESSVVQAAVDVGMRIVAGQGFIDFKPPDAEELRRKAAAAESFIAKWGPRAPMVTPSLFCHSAYTCDPETLRTVKRVADAAGVPFMMHLSETKDEVDIIRSRYGARPVHHLRSLGLLGGKCAIVHGVWLEDDEMDILAESGTGLCHCPESNMKLASGIAPVPELLARGAAVGLGTDGSASNNDLDMLLELDTMAKLHKVATMNPTAMDAETALRIATIGGARVLGLQDLVGTVEPGKRADLIVIDLRRPHLTPLYHPFSQVVYACRGGDVRDSIIDGKVVMRNRELLTLDVRKIMDDVREIAERVKRG
ncbi:MAG: amidohydrolase [Syntrophaceae bacterium]|nr:amidohydrolase [Syntrophaceae bacterium]